MLDTSSETGAAVTGLPVAGAVVNQKEGEQAMVKDHFLDRLLHLNLYLPAETGCAVAGCWLSGAADTGMAVTGDALIELDVNVGGTGIGAAETGAAVTGLPVAGAVVKQKDGEQAKL